VAHSPHVSKAQIYYDKHHSIEQKEAWIASGAVDARTDGRLTRPNGAGAGRDVDTYSVDLPGLMSQTAQYWDYRRSEWRVKVPAVGATCGTVKRRVDCALDSYVAPDSAGKSVSREACLTRGCCYDGRAFEHGEDFFCFYADDDFELWFVRESVEALFGHEDLATGQSPLGVYNPVFPDDKIDLNGNGDIDEYEIQVLTRSRGWECDGSGTQSPCQCADSITNGLEPDTDCGGPECPLCKDGWRCTRDSDCLSLKCDLLSGALGRCKSGGDPIYLRGPSWTFGDQ
jgi:hypothetical protein